VASGKSTVASRLAIEAGAPIIRTDDIRREIFPLMIDYGQKERWTAKRVISWIESNDTDKINFQEVLNPLLESTDKEYRGIVDKYRPLIEEQKRVVYEKAFERLSAYLGQGKSVVFDGTFSKRKMRERAYEIARRRGLKTVYIVQVTCGGMK